MPLLPAVNLHFHLSLYYIHAISKFHVKWYLYAENIIAVHSATVGWHSHFVSFVVIRQTCFNLVTVCSFDLSVVTKKSEEQNREIVKLLDDLDLDDE